ncbi:uncharacterized protein LOC133386880 [Rhineura floridana]|uniref:uncharacterized protein LOC133386880 n=1 Tax=Rhineura floridana TaxID=261503 RepID=UPI002AC85425|nr:uncharacterized protein LOC133386880 [Rhineura floridana]
MHAIMDHCSLSRITAAEIEVVQEYTEIMEPLAQSLDILQRENGMFMGYLLPTLCNLDRKLEGLENKPERYTYCFQLLRGVHEALRKRFAAIWEDKRLLLAACLHPRFKLDRLESCQATTHTNKYTMEALLKAEIKIGVLNEDSDQSSDKDQEAAVQPPTQAAAATVAAVTSLFRRLSPKLQSLLPPASHPGCSLHCRRPPMQLASPGQPQQSALAPQTDHLALDPRSS